jgi:hypothetical protein
MRPGDDLPRPASIDSTRASITRVYDSILGGKDNYEADRAVRDRLLALAPEFPRAAWDSRHFLVRVTRFLAGEAAISQFIDCGACLPIGENTHEVAQRFNREAATVYVAKDPLVLALGRALLADNDQTHMADVDFRRPQRVLSDPTVRKYLDFQRPMAVYHVGTLHHLPDRDDPWQIMADYIKAIPSGSYVVLFHMLDPGDDNELAALAAGVQEVYLNSDMASGWFRTPDQIRAMMPGLELVEPGLVLLADWWPDGPRPRPLAPIQRLALGAVGRKP